MKKKLLILAGDGIGPEVMNEVKKIIVWFNKNKSADFDITEELAGGISFDKHGEPITDKVMKIALESDAVLLGAVGGPKWDKLEFSKKPERALLRLRKDLELFANLRPAICFKELANASTLKPEIVSDLDIMIVRELTGGIYFGSPRGVEKLSNGEKKGITGNTSPSPTISRSRSSDRGRLGNHWRWLRCDCHGRWGLDRWSLRNRWRGRGLKVRHQGYGFLGNRQHQIADRRLYGVNDRSLRG